MITLEIIMTKMKVMIIAAMIIITVMIIPIMRISTGKAGSDN